LTSQVELDYQKSSLCIKNYLDVYISNQKIVFKSNLKRSSLLTGLFDTRWYYAMLSVVYYLWIYYNEDQRVLSQNICNKWIFYKIQTLIFKLE